jgi:hypothetical protein
MTPELVTPFHGQIQRIKSKLLEAKAADKDLKVFGADRHKYLVNPPASPEEVLQFEQKYAIELPVCYKSFLLNIGNGGTSFADSAAGPFYGIYPLGRNVDELIPDNTEAYLKNECLLFPEMSDDYWDSLTRKTDHHANITDEEFDRETGKLFGGILPIGSQGCTYLQGIALNGKYKGRVVNLDLERQKPRFAGERNFLDWYERWLDEVISGYLITDITIWFGYKGRDERKY